MIKKIITLVRKKNSALIIIFAVLIFGSLGSILLFSAKADTEITGQKMVWATTAVPTNRDINSLNSFYGANYPLYIRQPGVDTAPYTISAARQANVTGLAVYVGSQGMRGMERYAAEADTYNDMLVAPMISPSNAGDQTGDARTAQLQQLRSQIVLYAKTIAPKYHSAAKIEGKYMITVDGITAITVAEWQTLQSQVVSDGANVYWVMDVGGKYGTADGSIANPGVVQSYTPIYSAGFPFNGRLTPAAFAQAKSIVSGQGKLFLGGAAPGYYRGYRSDTGVKTPHGDDPMATALYRQELEMQQGLPWFFISTWDDIVEHTAVNKTSEWNATRFDLTAWYASKFLGKPAPFSDARLYITTPQSVYKDQADPAEALIINPTGRTLTARITVTDSAGKTLGTASATVGPNSVGAASVDVKGAWQPSGYFTRATATMFDGSATKATVNGAPSLIYSGNAGDRKLGSTLYNSIPASAALPANVSLSMAKNGAGVASTITTSQTVTVNISELIHDTVDVTKVSGSLLRAIPINTSKAANLTDNRGDADDYQLYVARVIDTQNRVGYSDPFYLPSLNAPASKPINGTSNNPTAGSTSTNSKSTGAATKKSPAGQVGSAENNVLLNGTADSSGSGSAVDRQSFWQKPVVRICGGIVIVVAALIGAVLIRNGLHRKLLYKIHHGLQREESLKPTSNLKNIMAENEPLITATKLPVLPGQLIRPLSPTPQDTTKRSSY